MKQQRNRNEFKMTAVKMANAHMESFFHTMKTERIRGRTFTTFAELEAALTASIRFYNHHRLPIDDGVRLEGGCAWVAFWTLKVLKWAVSGTPNCWKWLNYWSCTGNS
jgi:hypothetical protein